MLARKRREERDRHEALTLWRSVTIKSLRGARTRPLMPTPTPGCDLAMKGCPPPWKGCPPPWPEVKLMDPHLMNQQI
jgi:hypothetical protein